MTHTCGVCGYQKPDHCRCKKYNEDDVTYENRMLSQLEMEQGQMRKKAIQNFNAPENFDRYYERVIRNAAEIPYAITPGMTLKEYMITLKAYVKMHARKNINTHMLGNYEWATHRHPQGCFMCEDTNMIHYLMSLIGYLANKYPEDSVEL